MKKTILALASLLSVSVAHANVVFPTEITNKSGRKVAVTVERYGRCGGRVQFSKTGRVVSPEKDETSSHTYVIEPGKSKKVTLQGGSRLACVSGTSKLELKDATDPQLGPEEVVVEKLKSTTYGGQSEIPVGKFNSDRDLFELEIIDDNGTLKARAD